MDYVRVEEGPILVLDVNKVTVNEIKNALEGLSLNMGQNTNFILRDGERRPIADVNGTYNLKSHTDYYISLKTQELDSAASPKESQQEIKHTSSISFAKRDYLRDIEVKMQKRWLDERIFELDALASNESGAEPYMATFPYPYMNGRLHLGHTFSLSKAEFSIGYQRLKGKRALFPFGFHCTGMPIMASADKLAYEMENFGYPPVFPDKSGSGNIKIYLLTQEKTFKSKKSKSVSKSGGGMWQWQIMRDLGFSDEEIKKFTNAGYWIDHFPVYAIEDMKSLGLGIDWRRSFVTTDINPYYDSFIRWQFSKLKKQNKVLFGKRNTIYSPKDNGSCLDHDRYSGEGVVPVEFTLIKQKLLQPYPDRLRHLGLVNMDIYLVPATLRPETMYGQTNCWVLPDGEYGVFAVKNNEIFICTDRSMRNMSFQDITPVWGVTEKLMSIKGVELIGCMVNAPCSIYENVYVLPMMNILMDKGTGIVTSVPSDSLEDFVALNDLLNKPDFRAKYSIKDEMIIPFKPVPMISLPELGVMSAEACVKKFSIKSQNDRILLQMAREYYNKLSFSGVFVAGPFVGQKSESVKSTAIKEMIAESLALSYAEPASEVISRSGDICVVALVDQWYLDYGDPAWRALAKECLNGMQLYSDEVRQAFDKAIDWINSWACSRSYGLGSRIPWDERSLIDSLSDSTIYMAYYTVCHYLHADLQGKVPGLGNISPELMTYDVWEYIFCGVPLSDRSSIDAETLRAMRDEFLYWYPVDLRVSGKDLIYNHLLFFIYNHVAIFDRAHWPRSIRINGHILLNKAKMSKSSGNFITLKEGVERYTADGMRFSLADAGDTSDDANFMTDSADSILLKLYTQIEWIKSILDSELREGPFNFMDEIFENQILLTVDLTDKAYANMEYKEAVKVCFYELQNFRDVYQDISKTEGILMHRDLIHKFVRTQVLLLAPICPHWSEYIWTELLMENESVLRARFPQILPYDNVKLDQFAYLIRNLHIWRVKVLKFHKKNANIHQQVEKATLIVQRNYIGWRQRCIELFETQLDSKCNEELSHETILGIVRGDPQLSGRIKNAVQFIKEISALCSSKGMQILHPELVWDEIQVLNLNKSYICKSINVKELEVLEACHATGHVETVNALPGSPSLVLE